VSAADESAAAVSACTAVSAGAEVESTVVAVDDEFVLVQLTSAVNTLAAMSSAKIEFFILFIY
jgi:hypothetical protein